MAITDGLHYHQKMVHVLRKRLTTANASGTYSLGWVPPGAVIHRAGVTVRTVFNAGAGNTLDIGYRNGGNAETDDTDEYATALALGTAGIIVADELATAAVNVFPRGAELVAVLTYSSTTPTTGDVVAWVEFSVDNEEDF